LLLTCCLCSSYHFIVGKEHRFYQYKNKFRIFIPGENMSTNLIKKSAVALAVTGALFAASTVSAATAEQYNLNNKKLTKPSAVEVLKENKNFTSSWLVKLKTASISQSSAANINSIENSQNSVLSAIKSMDLNVTVLAKTSKLVNSIVIKGDKRDVEKLLANSEVENVYPVYDYELDIADSADYIKATPLVEGGVANGEGVRVAVLDTGVDYTHAIFGGAGTLEAYAEAATDPTDEVSWPQGQVKGGWDFVNNDPDPIDAGTSHGTHVSHSVTGIAPNVELFVYSVCNSGCPGLAQLLALEAAMDPNGDGNIEDRVDVINMSLGGNYGGPATDAVGLLINEAVRLGTNLVISAGNDGAYPFIVGGPSTSENALSVGAMTHPVTKAAVIEGAFLGEEADVNASGFNPEPEFSFDNTAAPLVYPTDNQMACDPFADGTDFAGKAVIIDRGACNFTQKVINAQDKGALFVLIANHTPEAGATAPGGSDPKNEVKIPSVGISYELGMALKDALAAEEDVAYSVSSELFDQEGAIASFTSRGPSMTGLLKPEITAPGVAIMTAEPGTGDGLTPINGTSFSGPMTAGAVSLLKEALPERNAFELKATLMNTASLNVTMKPRATHPDTTMAPISYIGAGLVDVEKASNLPVAAWAKDTKQAALSFGLVNLAETTELTKTVQVKNFSNEAKTYTLALEQRFADDVERGALAMSYPESITVPAGQVFSFDVVATIDPSKLPEWTLHSGNVSDPKTTEDLTTLELDGALNFLADGEQAFHLVYHVLPKAAASVEITPTLVDKETVHVLTNTGSVDFEPFFAPIVVSDEVDSGVAGNLDLVSGSIETIASEYCPSGYSTYSTLVMNEGIMHSYTGKFAVDFDMDQDGQWDITVQSGKEDWWGVTTGVAIALTTGYDASGSWFKNSLYHTTGNNFITLESCLGAFGLEDKHLGEVTANVRFRTQQDDWIFAAEDSVNEVIGEYTFAESMAVAELVSSVNEGDAAADESASSDIVKVLKPGESAQINTAGTDFVVLSTSGSKALNATPSTDAGIAPVVTAAEFSVDENTANEAVIGQLEVTYPAEFANPVAEYIVVNSTSSAVNVTASGSVVVANAEQLDFESGLTMVELEVVAVNTSGTVSESEMIKVMVNNVADSAPELTVTVVAETVAENNERTLIADLTAMINEADATLASFEVTEGDAFEIEDAQLFLKAGQDFEAGAELMAKVVAKDSAELMSTAVDVKVTLTDIDETPVVVTPPKKKSSSGSLAWLMLLATPFAFLRRRKSQK
jgi:hypothetical protein